MQSTRLEAIMFTDIAGYSRLMDEDEDRTIALLKRHNELVLPVIEAESGTVIDAIGDGLLVVFPSVRRAVSCGVAINEAVEQHNEAAGEAERFRVRIGIHLGEVRHEDNRVFGTGINIAARVQPFALPGGIAITEDVYRQVERRIPQAIESIGVQELKNIARRFELFRVVTGCEAEPAGQPPDAPAEPAQPAGELDRIKERVLSEIAHAGEHRHRDRDDDGESREERLENRIESKVYGLVEHVMDKAIDKWDGMPEEKKSKIVESIKVEIDSGGKKKKDKDDDSASSIAGEIGWGVAATAGLGIWYYFAGSTWMIVVGVLAGVFPLMSGIGKLIKRGIRRRGERSRKPALLERQVLRAARDLGGRVTVVQISAHTGYSLDEIQATLDSMTSKGYVSQEVLETGVIRYDFPSLLPGETDSDPIV